MILTMDFDYCTYNLVTLDKWFKFTTDISILTHNFKVTKCTLSQTGQQENGHTFLGTSPT